jgi:tRNA dimethylallyltransferase
MSTNSFQKIITVIGPTASGKSDLAVNIALFIKKNTSKLIVPGAEIISADSRQIYKWLDIGSNKITAKEMRGVPHHLLGIANPKRTFTVAQYQKLADKTIRQIIKRGNIPILCGGTGLYIDSIIYGTKFPGIKPNPSLRKKLEKIETSELFALLSKRDPQRASTIDKNNRRRLIRALEIVIVSGKPVPQLKQEPRFNTLWIGLKINKNDFKKRLSSRLEKRVKIGLIKEVRNLHKTHGLSWKRLESFGLEYRFVSQFLQNKISKTKMKGEIVNESAQYAKRQITWFKRNKQINWLDEKQKALDLVESFLSA